MLFRLFIEVSSPHIVLPIFIVVYDILTIIVSYINQFWQKFGNIFSFGSKSLVLYKQIHNFT